ncbi:MAG: phosphate signaling complex protein PhoU [Candidatus Omnitrophica bacterium]|nr:phosphate signaling complex protein PhoU [Candidatus Omnitrophota bacterium]MDE2221826.1 phosphate signaling complex protein PhoU [Candidatus Omnitrophota bacterium]
MLRDKITELKHQLIQDAGLVEDMISRSMRGLLEKNADMLYQVVKHQEPRVNAYDRSIDELCVETIARFEPVARDLRMVIMIIKMNKDLERMADHAVNISESGLYLIANPFIGSYTDLFKMGEEAVAMLKDAINAFVNEDVATARSVRDRDNIVDEAGDKILKELTVVMRGKKDTIPRALALMRIAHNLERIADLSTNIAEEVVYIVEGRDIKHHKDDNA